MGEKTEIAWCDATFNPWMGCAKVSSGCAHCYAERLTRRFGYDLWGNGPRRRTSDESWYGPPRWQRRAQRTGRRIRVFCGSLCDVFETHAVPLWRDWLRAWRVDLFGLIERCPDLDWLLLTKRPENIQEVIVRATGKDAGEWLPANPQVWLGATVENQEMADLRIPELMRWPAKVRFLSCEPLLAPVDLKPWLWELADSGGFTPWGAGIDVAHPTGAVDWVIAGGESGRYARPMDLAWAHDLRRQCQAAGVPFFFKQLGAYLARVNDVRAPGHNPAEWPAELRVQEFPHG